MCSGPLRTDCLQCMDGYVLQDGACVEQCSASFYRDLGLCKSKCLQPFSVLTQASISFDCPFSEKESMENFMAFYPISGFFLKSFTLL